MAQIVWLASYPKSGNTWFRALLTNYLADGDEPASIDRLRGTPVAADRSWFDAWSGIEASALDHVSVERLRPEVYRLAAAQGSDTLYLKVHDMWHRTDRGEPLFPPEETAAVIYLVRNPLDIVTSLANHRNATVAEITADLCRPNFASPGIDDPPEEQLPQLVGSWEQHVRSWTQESGLTLCLVRYEDLLDEPVQTFTRALSVCGIRPELARVRKAVAFSRFEELRRQEAAHGFREMPNQNQPFFRRGEADRGRNELEPELVQTIVHGQGETMARLGYLDDRGGRLR